MPSHLRPNPRRTVTISGRVYNAAALRRYHESLALLRREQSRAGPDAPALPVPLSCAEALSPWWFFPLLQEDVEREERESADALAAVRDLTSRWVDRPQQEEEEEEAEPAGSNFIYIGEGSYGGEGSDVGQGQDNAETAVPASTN